MSTRAIAASTLAATLLLAGGTARAAADDPPGWNGFTFGQNGLRWASPDENVKLRAGGRIHGDFYLYDDDTTPIDDSNQLRRARLFLSGALFEDLRFKLEGDVTNRRRGWRNLWGAYRGVDDLELKGGQFIAPQGFEDLMSSNDMTFMERSVASALAPRFRAGGQVAYWQRQWSVRVGGFSDPLNGDAFDNSQTDGPDFLARVTGAPVRDGGKLLHLGGSFRWRDVDDDKTSYRVSTRPESGGAPKLLDTGRIPGVDSDMTLGIELAGTWGPVSLQGEYLHRWVDLLGSGDPQFHGGYLQLAWFPTGERRRYSSRRAVFSSVRPKQPWGAVELAIRYSGLDLTDEGIRGGDAQDVSLGINWYVLRNFRAMFNYVYADTRVGGSLVKDRPHIFQFRIQANL